MIPTLDWLDLQAKQLRRGLWLDRIFATFLLGAATVFLWLSWGLGGLQLHLAVLLVCGAAAIRIHMAVFTHKFLRRYDKLREETHDQLPE